MFTQNYIEYRSMMFLGGSPNFVNCVGTRVSANPAYSFFGDIGIAMRTARCQAQRGSGTNSTEPYEASSYVGVYFGTGSTPAAKSDYKLESPIESGLSIVNPSIRIVDGVVQLPVSEANGRYTYEIPFAVKNTTESEINIWEIGVFGEVANRISSTSYPSYPVLFERTVLSEPITLQPGESKVITYKMTFNQTLNVE